MDLDEVYAAKNTFAQGDPSCLPELPGVRALGNAISDPAPHRSATPEPNETGMEWHRDGCGITLLHAAQVPAGPVRITGQGQSLPGLGFGAFRVWGSELR